MQKDDLSSGPLRAVSLRDQALEVVRLALVSGEIRPGGIYSAAALATKLGVSNSPVREAMLTLVNEGLMEPVRNRGFRVVPMSDHDLDEVYDLRMMLEVPAMTRLAEMADRLDVPAAAKAVRLNEQAAREGDVARFLESDRMFHLSLLEPLGNRRLSATVANLRDQTRLYGLEVLAERGQLMVSVAEHRQLLDAVLANDADRAKQIMSWHLGHVRAEWADIRQEPRAGRDRRALSR